MISPGCRGRRQPRAWRSEKTHRHPLIGLRFRSQASAGRKLVTHVIPSPRVLAAGRCPPPRTSGLRRFSVTFAPALQHSLGKSRVELFLLRELRTVSQQGASSRRRWQLFLRLVWRRRPTVAARPRAASCQHRSRRSPRRLGLRTGTGSWGDHGPEPDAHVTPHGRTGGRRGPRGGTPRRRHRRGRPGARGCSGRRSALPG